LLKQIRGVVGSARWFTSDEAYAKLVSFVNNWLLKKIDVELSQLIKSKSEKNYG